MSHASHIVGRIALGMAALAAVSAAGAEPPARTITVSAMAEFEVPPTEVVLSLAVVTENEDLLIAKQFNDAFTRDVLKLGAKHSVPAEHFELDTLSIQPKYEGKSYFGRGELVGYVVTRGIDVTLRDFDQLEPVLSGALAAGANRVGGILWRTMDHRKHQFEARRRAVEHAKEKASHLAELNGLKLGRAIKIEEDVEGRWNRETGGFGGIGAISGAAPPSPDGPGPVDHRFRLVSAQPKLRPATREEPVQHTSGTVAPGTITVSAEVMITFELLPLDE
jgi:uncharacterized protein YggE